MFFIKKRKCLKGLNNKAIEFLRKNYIVPQEEQEEYKLWEEHCISSNSQNKNTELCLKALKKMISDGKPNALSSLLDVNAEYFSDASNTTYCGLKEILHRFKHIHKVSKRKCYTYFATIISPSTKYPEIEIGTRCVVISYGKIDFYESIAFIKINEKGKISNINIISDREFKFILDNKPLEALTLIDEDVANGVKYSIRYSVSPDNQNNDESQIKYSDRYVADNYNQNTVKELMKDCTSPSKLESIISGLDSATNQSFVDKIIFYINNKNLKDSTVYKAAQIDRRLFSKIMSDRHYKPAKDTAMAISLALELSYDEATDLLSRAGYTLSHSNKRDIIIEYFIREKHYNLNDINEVLFNLGQKIIGR